MSSADPQRAAEHSKLAQAAFRARRRQDMRVHLEAAVACGSESARDYFLLGNLLKDAGEETQARAHYERCVALDASMHAAQFNLATLHRKAGRTAEAVSAYEAALVLRPGYRRAVISFGELLLELDRREDATRLFERAVEAGALEHPLQRASHHVAGLPSRPWYDPARFDFLRTFEAQAGVIAEELENLLRIDAAQIKPWKSDALAVGGWSKFFFWFKAVRNPHAATLCPRTAALFDDLTVATSMPLGNICFSVIEPQTHIKAHCGPTNTRLRCHLGIVVPEGATLRVGTQERPWRQGEWLVFDDSFEHEAHNRSAARRVVLLMDIWHPALDTAAKQRQALS